MASVHLIIDDQFHTLTGAHDKWYCVVTDEHRSGKPIADCEFSERGELKLTEAKNLFASYHNENYLLS